MSRAKRSVSEYLLTTADPDANDDLALIDFLEKSGGEYVLGRPDVQLVRACSRGQAFVYRRKSDGKVVGTGSVFRYQKGKYLEAGAARISKEIGGYGKEQWGMTLHEFLHRIRVVHAYLGNKGFKQYFGVVREDNDNNVPKLSGLGFRRWPGRPPAALLQEREEIIARGMRSDDKPLVQQHAKLWLVLPKLAIPRLAGDLRGILNGESRRRTRRDVKFDLKRRRRIQDSGGAWRLVEPVEWERIRLHVDIPLLTEDRITLERVSEEACP